MAFVGAPPEPDDPLLCFAPYLHPAPRGNSITPERQRAFIAALAASGIVTQAARRIGASLEALYKLRRLPGAEGFAHAWEAALDHGVARLEDCALALALEGEELPIVSGGKLLGTYRKHNFGHIRFMLSQRRGERFAPIRGTGERALPAAPADLPPALPPTLPLAISAAEVQRRRDVIAGYADPRPDDPEEWEPAYDPWVRATRGAGA